MITAEALIAALELPSDCRVDQRVTKKILIEQGLPTPADKRKVQDGIEDIRWIAALKPNRIGVPAFADEARSYREIVVISATLRGKAGPARLIELLHRLVPHPVLMVIDQGGVVTLSAAHKRLSLGEGGKTVLDGSPVSEALCGDEESAALEADFRASLPLARLPSSNLFELYGGWIGRIEALKAARITGSYGVSGEHRTGALAGHESLKLQLVKLRKQARQEKQMNRRVDLNLEIKKLDAELSALTEKLR